MTGGAVPRPNLAVLVIAADVLKALANVYDAGAAGVAPAAVNILPDLAVNLELAQRRAVIADLHSVMRFHMGDGINE